MAQEYELIKKAVADAMTEQMKDFYVDRETHYQHHEFIDGMMEWSRSWKSTCMRAIANALVMGVIGLLLLGYIAWGGKMFKG